MTRGPRSPRPLTVDADVRRELRSHLAMRVEELIADGASPADARRQARQEFGDYQRIAGECRHISRSGSRRSLTIMLDALRQDIAFAARTLRRSPGFLLTAVLTLGLGIGANTAIFSVLDGVLLEPLPYPEPDRLVAMWERSERGTDNNVASANFHDWEGLSTTFEAMSLIPNYRFGGRATVLGGEIPARLFVGGVSRDFFRVMGVDPLLGRTFSPDDAEDGATPTVVVSHRVWAGLLGQPDNLADVEVDFYGTRWQVIGVMPPGFAYPGETGIWWPAALGGFNSSRTSHNWAAVGRLRDGVPFARAQEELASIGAALKEEFGDDTNAVGVNLYRLHDEVLGSTRQPLLLLLGASAMVLLVACTNIASTLLARATGRRQEIAVRGALGAGRKRLVRQLLTESLLLAFAGAVAGMVIAGSALTLLLRLAPALPRADQIGVDTTALGFTLLLTVLTSLLFGLAPAWRLARGSSVAALRDGGRSHGAGSSRIWTGLVVAEVALALVLLTGSGLLLRSFWNVVSIDAGFEHEGVLTVQLAAPSSLYPENEDVGRYLQQALATVGSVPGVASSGLVNHVPLGGARINGSFDIEGEEPGTGYGDYRVVGGDYFAAMGIALIAGRTFAPSDDAGAEPVVIVNAALARRFFGDDDPIGRRIGNLANDAWIYGEDWMRIVGVVGDVRHRDLTGEANQEVYVHYLQRPMRARGSQLVLRSAGDAAGVVEPVRERLRALDDQVPLEFSTMTARVAGSVAPRRFTATVLASFALVAVALSAVGIYGVVSYTVARQRREIGIRLALGASPTTVRRAVVLRSLGAVAMGLALGVGVALALGRVMAGMLFAVEPGDPLTLASVSALLGGIAWVASYVPARRSSGVDPLIAMRAD